MSAGGLVRRAVAFELGMWRGLARWVRRRPDVPPGAEAFGYADAVTPVIWAFIGVSAVEIPLVHFIVPWPVVRFLLLLAGVYGVLWMVGLLGSLKTSPHTVGDDGLRVRHGGSVDVLVPWEEIAGVRVRRRSVEGSRTVHLHEDGPRRAASVNVGASTQLDVELRGPRVLPLPRTGGAPVQELRIAADDPAALARRLRAGLGSSPAR